MNKYVFICQEVEEIINKAVKKVINMGEKILVEKEKNVYLKGEK